MGKKLIKKRIKVEGMTCTGCESKIENKLIKMHGIYEIDASCYADSLTVVYDSEEITLTDIINTVRKLGYDVRLNETQDNSQKGSNNQLIVIGIIILGLYLIIKNTVGFNFIPQIDPSMGYGILFVVGLLSSLHCIAMCGGINLSLSVSHKFEHEGKNRFVKIMPSLLYNAGRVVSYTIIGGIVGALGSVFTISNTGSAFITILAGTFMVIMGLNMLNIFPWLKKLNPHMPKIFANKIYKANSNKGPFVVGLLNGLMPCGPLQAMQLYALGTGSFLAGALSMFMFSLGTVPLLFAFGALGSMLSSKFAKNMVRVSAMLVILLGIVMMNRGMAFTGISFGSLTASASTDNAAISSIVGSEQQITTTLDGGTYSPIAVQAGTPVKWTINVDKGDLNGCNNEIIIPEYNIKQKLEVGENVITFTPTETGKFGYSCWMGMIKSSITVVEDIQNADATKDALDSTSVNNSGMPAGCCGV
ncbi:MAG: sulfite exporter TauE/SafE family protein [Aminipila sp.]